MAGKKKPTGKPKHASKAHKVKGATQIFGAKEKQRMLKAPADWKEIARDTINKWMDNRALLKIMDLTPGKLRSLLGKAERSAKAEDKANLKATKLASARLSAVSTLWKNMLYAKKTIEDVADKRPAVREIFDLLLNCMKRGPAADVTPAPTDEPKA